MTEPRRIPPKRPTQYDLRAMNDEDFEALVARLVRLEHPDAFKPANTGDGGADVVLQGAANEEGTERCWQAKHYPGPIRWDKCKKSLADAKEHWQPRHYTFVFPRDLTGTELKTFEKHFGGEDITVDFWNDDRLQALLTDSEEGRRVATTFFSDVEEDKKATNLAIAAGGKLDSTDDALDRLGNVGGALAKKDAYFMYPSATREADQPGPPATPGSVMSVEKFDGATVSRIDVVPRDPEAMERYGPQFVLSAEDTPDGRKAAETVTEALKQGKGFAVGKGLQVTLTQLPPGLSDIAGETLAGSVVATPLDQGRPSADPLEATLIVKRGSSQSEFSATLSQTDTVPDGWNDAFSGETGGLKATLLMRESGSGGEAQWNFSHRRTATSVAEQVKALRFMRAFAAGGELLFRTQHGAFPSAPAPAREFSEDAQTLLAFLEDVLVIEKWIGRALVLPETIEADDARGVAITAGAIRRGGFDITWNSSEMTLTDPTPLSENPRVMIEQELDMRLFGDVINLGYVQVELTDYRIEDLGPDPDGGRRVQLLPPEGESGRMLQTLTKKPTKGRRKPPPPPPRKANKKNRGGKKKRRRR